MLGVDVVCVMDRICLDGVLPDWSIAGVIKVRWNRLQSIEGGSGRIWILEISSDRTRQERISLSEVC